MKEKEAKKLELNTKILDNFETIMATRLEEIEELKVTELDKGLKIVNIISLCANLKTLILEGDQRLNCDKILANVFKPEKLENLFLNNVKIPKSSALKRYTNLKMISLNEIRFCDVQDFFDGIINPEVVEIISISNTDMFHHSIRILERFSQFKYLNLEDVKNLKLDDLSFLKKNQQILKINIVHNQIPLNQINALLACECVKNIVVDVINEKGKNIPNCKIQIQDENKITLDIPGEKLENVLKKVDLCLIDKIRIIFNKVTEEPCTRGIKLLRKSNQEIHVIVKDFSCLDTQKAKNIKNILKLDEIEFEHKKSVDIITFIEIRTEMERILEKTLNCENEYEKFLQIYRVLGKEFQVAENENLNIKNKTCNSLQICEFLQNCLKCVSIASNIITGEDLENDKKHIWNQVELEKMWYNIDLNLDLENIKKNKTEYCLLSDKEFLKTHMPKSGRNHYCAENFNPKLVAVFFKTGLFKESFVGSYVEIMVEKIKKLFMFNKKQEVLALPEAKIDKNSTN